MLHQQNGFNDFRDLTSYSEFSRVMEYMEGGDVFDRILSLQRYTEKDARDLVGFLLETVGFIHARGVAHRDLKPQNILLKVRNNSTCDAIRIFYTYFYLFL